MIELSELSGRIVAAVTDLAVSFVIGVPAPLVLLASVAAVLLTIAAIMLIVRAHDFRQFDSLTRKRRSDQQNADLRIVVFGINPDAAGQVRSRAPALHW